MRNLMILAAMLLFCSSALFAQVKEKFRDNKNTSTIVVVKEDNAIDQNLLDEHFDLNEMSMSDQIMITTAPDQAPPPPDLENATASTGENIEDFFEDFDSEEVEVLTETDAPTEQTVEVKETKEEDISSTPKSRKPVSSTVRSASTRAKGTYKVKSSAQVKKAAQKKYFGKKKKKNKKRKRYNKRKSNSCYSF